MDLTNNLPDMSTARIVRIKAGTQIIIPAGKAHFLAVAEGSEPVEIIVVAPKMDTPSMNFPESIKGVAWLSSQ